MEQNRRDFLPLNDQSYCFVRVTEKILRVQMSQVSGIVHFNFTNNITDSQATFTGRSGIHLYVQHPHKTHKLYYYLFSTYRSII